MKIKVVERYLALSLFILNLQACSAVLGRQKILVDLNLSRALPGKIMAIYSREMHGAMNYTVKGNARHTHIIGAVIDRGQLLVPGDATNMSRYVLVYNRDDGTKYVRIATRKRIARNYFCRIDEFIKRGTDFEYTKIERIPVTLGLPIEANNNDITVNFIPDERYPERFNKEYTVKDEMKDYLVIGTVMYGDMILDEKTDGLINRTVTWEGGAGRPKIVVSSRYQDGMETDIKYAFIDGNLDKFYIWDARKRLMNLYE